MDHARARSSAAPARTGPKPGDFVCAAVTGAVGGAGGAVVRVVGSAATVVTVVWGVGGTVVFTVVGALVTAVVRVVVAAETLIKGFLSWSSRLAESVEVLPDTS